MQNFIKTPSLFFSLLSQPNTPTTSTNLHLFSPFLFRFFFCFSCLGTELEFGYDYFLILVMVISLMMGKRWLRFVEKWTYGF